MALTIQAAGGVEEAIDGWIETEDTEHAIEARVAEVEKEMTSEMLCGLIPTKTASEVVVTAGTVAGVEMAESGKDQDAASDDKGADDSNNHQPTRDEIEEIATKMMALAVEVEKLGEPYLQPQTWLSDAAEEMRRIHRMTAPVVDSTRPTKMTSYFPTIKKKRKN